MESLKIFPTTQELLQTRTLNAESSDVEESLTVLDSSTPKDVTIINDNNDDTNNDTHDGNNGVDSFSSPIRKLQQI